MTKARRNRSADESEDEGQNLHRDSSRSMPDKVREILCALVQKSGVTKAKKLTFLNSLVKLLTQNPEARDFGLRKREVLICLRIPLTHDSAEVRAATLRVLRYLATEENDVRDLNRVNIHYLIAKCLDIDLDNRLERVHAVRLARKCLFLAPQYLSPTIVRSLVAVAQGDPKDPDRLQRACLAILCELSLFNSDLFVRCQGVHVLTHSLLDCNMPRITEAVLGSLLHLYNHPETRTLAKIRLDLIVAPYTGFRYVHHEQAPQDGSTNEVEFHFQSAHHVILSTLRSWSGLTHLARFTDKLGHPVRSPIKSLVEVLHLNRSETRKLVILLLFEALSLVVPKHYNTHERALEYIKCDHFRDLWKLTDGFVASEGLDILPPLSCPRPNLLDSHLSLLLYCLLSAKLPDALAVVIVNSDTELSVLATILLGEFLYLAYRLLPREVNIASHCLPPLLDEVASPDHVKALKAQEAVTALRQCHALKKRGPVANSLILDQILTNSSRGSDFMGEPFVGDRIQLSPVPWSYQGLMKSSEASRDRTSGQTFIHDSKVTSTSEADEWDWDAVTALFKWPTESFMALETTMARQFIKRITDFYLPSNDLFAKVDLNKSRAKYLARTGCYFFEFLLKSKSPDSSKALDELLDDICSQVQTLLNASPSSYGNCLFSPNRIGTTCCQHYFLFLGRLSKSDEGRKILDAHQVLQSLFSLLLLKNEMYLKLIVACLDYSSPDWGSRNLLRKALRETSESCRIYSTRFLAVLVRSRTPSVAQWGIEFLVNQLFDESKVIPWMALDFLLEACSDKMNLEAMICTLSHRINTLDHLGLRGSLLVTLMLSSANGFKYLSKVGYIRDQLSAWAQGLNLEYVRHVEELLNDGFSHHQHTLDQTYGRRTQEAHKLRNVFVPPHLYGQLAQTPEGVKMLLHEEAFKDMLALVKVKNRRPSNSGKPYLKTSDILQLKTAIWGICHVGSSPLGAAFIEKENVLHILITWAETSIYYSLQGTAFYALSLLATHRKGAKMLAELGWVSLRYASDDKWPVPEELEAHHLQAMQLSLEGQPMSVQEAEKSLFGLYDSQSDPHGQGLDRGRILDDSDHHDLDERSLSSRSDTSSKNISTRKRLSAMFRSFSLGQKSEEQSSGNEDSNKKIPAKLRRRLFQTKSFEVDSDTHPEDMPKFRLSLATNDSGSSRGHSEPPVEVAPIATPDGDSDVILASPVHAESTPIHNQTPSTTFTNSSSTSGVSSQGSTPISKPTSHFNPSAPRRLSPIPSSSSLSNLKSPLSPPPEIHEPRPMETLAPTSSSQVVLRSRQAIRSGQRTCSESEAANLTLSHLPTSTATHLVQPETAFSATSVSSISSWQNEQNPGYLTLRSIHNKRRPPLMLSDSTDTPALESPSAHMVTPHVGESGLEMKAVPHRQDTWTRKTRSLDYRVLNKMRPRLPSQVSNHDFTSTTRRSHRPTMMMMPLREESEDNGGPERKFWGITMPLNVDVLFPKDDLRDGGNFSLLSEDFLFHSNQPHLSSWLKNQVRQSTRRRSSLSTEQAANFQGLEFHTHSNCLGCFRMNLIEGLVEDEPDSGPLPRPRSGSLSVVCPGSSQFQNEDYCQQTRLIQSNQGSPIALRKVQSNRRESVMAVIGSGESFMDDLQGSNTSARSDFDGSRTAQSTVATNFVSGNAGPSNSAGTLTEGFLSKVNQRKEVLKMIGIMNATVGVKTAEQGLLKFKQKYPNVFNDLCLYSDVCILLSRYSFRLSTRRFIQELFMDLHFEELYEEPFKLLQLEFPLANFVAPGGLESCHPPGASGPALGQLMETPLEDVLYMA
ncbi:rapamycin-insensitive companion of mTOR-like isoform X2 [Tigriopus californicus]|uniref:rapamycin-insensitive companion of mTOR-like isoform X2 n=1 Tax=Tigriopus californicus TaxID=6832 RepID=UPI0027DA0CB9|nr:rapamycin-insensitive companion of mTOR-like isoform X2 [Tigriopus californicus]